MGLLLITRRVGETVTVGEGADAEDVTVVEVNGGIGSVRLAFDGAYRRPAWRREIAADRAIEAALDLALQHADPRNDGVEQQWVIDQMMRLLAGKLYGEIIPDGWDGGIAP